MGRSSPVRSWSVEFQKLDFPSSVEAHPLDTVGTVSNPSGDAIPRNLLTIVVATDNVRHVPNVIAQKLKQRTPFSTPEQEILLGLRIAAARVVEPWAKFLKATAQLSTNQYNVLRILRGSHPTKLACGDISERMIERDPDITRLVDRLAKRRLVTRARSRQDRRIVEVGITEQGLALLRELDVHVQRLPTALLGHLGPERGRQLAALLEAVIAGIGPFP